jgi:predicted nucleic acid-binding protein
MLVYLDSVICIYAVEGLPSLQARARARLATLAAAGDQSAISDLTWLECRVKPIRIGDAAALADMEAFLNATGVVRVPLTNAVYDRACRVRATYGFKLGDSLHLAAAAESGCGLFLTNDSWLATFQESPVEIL